MDAAIYETVSKWLEQSKKCITDTYVKGTFVHKKLIPHMNDETEWRSTPFEADVLGIRYEVVPQQTLSIDFYGYTVKIAYSETDLSRVLGDFQRLKGLPLHFGLGYVFFYIAYQYDYLKDDIRNVCDHEGIGVLQLQPTERGGFSFNEIVTANKLKWQGMSYSDQRSYGIFQNAAKRINYINDFLRSHPDKFFNDIMRPRLYTK